MLLRNERRYTTAIEKEIQWGFKLPTKTQVQQTALTVGAKCLSKRRLSHAVFHFANTAYEEIIRVVIVLN